MDYFNARASFLKPHAIEAVTKDGTKVRVYTFNQPFQVVLSIIRSTVVLLAPLMCYNLSEVLCVVVCLQSRLSAEHFVLAVGGRPKYPENVSTHAYYN